MAEGGGVHRQAGGRGEGGASRRGEHEGAVGCVWTGFVVELCVFFLVWAVWCDRRGGGGSRRDETVVRGG